jgi:RNA polymerase sigma-70 factor, ECF subfamily
MIERPFAGDAGGSGGFHAVTAVDASPSGLRETRRAVVQAKEGDRDALRFLYTRYSNNIYGYVRSIVHDHEEAEDITQQVFVKLMTRLTRYNERDVPFFAWLLRLAHNVAVDHLRSRRLSPTDNVLGTDLAHGVEVDRVDSVRAALDTLPETQRQVVILRDVVGLSPGEIAERMHRTESSIHGLHHRAKRALRQELVRLGSAPSARASRTAGAEALSAAGREVRQLTAA